MCEHILWIPVFNAEIEHYDGGFTFGMDFSLFYLMFKLQGVWLDTNTKYENFMTNLRSWQQANTLQIEITRNDSDTKLKPDGTNTVFPVLVVKPLEFEKMPADQEKFKIKNITLEQRYIAS